MRRAGLLLAWTAFLAASVVGLHAIGGALAPPPLTDPSTWDRWLDQRQPAEAAFAVVRLVALALAWYLLAATVTGAVLRLAGAGRLVRVADALTVPTVRHLVNGALGMSLAAVTLTGAAGASPASDQAQPPAALETMQRLPETAAGDGPVPTMQRLPDTAGGDSAGATTSRRPDTGADDPVGATTSRLPDTGAGEAAGATTSRRPDTGAGDAAGPMTPPLPIADAGDGPQPTMQRPDTAAGEPGGDRTSPQPDSAAGDAPTPTMQRLPDEAPAPAGAGTPSGEPDPQAVPAPPPADLRTWTVQPGDHFWSVAERVLAEAWRRAPADVEVDPFWRTLVEANRSRLRDPDNPDLLFPGQVIEVPAPPAPPR